MQTQSNSRPYQGYPYANTVITDVPSISSDAAARWTNLPRRPIMSDGSGGSGIQNTSQTGREQARLPPKREPDPVVYIDLPETSGTDMAQSIESQDTDEPSFVQDTIMYDPFENRRIEVGKRPDDAQSSISSVSDSSLPSPSSYPQSMNHERPNRPSTLDLNMRQISPSMKSNIPAFMVNESNVYIGNSNNGYQSEMGSNFPEPPPAYSETPGRTPGQEQRPPEVTPPRTQVITTNFIPEHTSPMGLPHPDRKFVTCHHCGKQVHTLVVREISFYSHLFAFILLVTCPPLVLLVYCTDYFKQKNHYCPNCNRVIGFVRPVVGSVLQLTH